MLATTTALLNRNAPMLDWYLMPEAYSAPLISEAIEEFGVRPGATVLDPFCGTGTTLVAARLAGRNAVGIEVNPFLCFASRVKTRDSFDLVALKKETRQLLAVARSELGRVDADTAPRSLEQLPEMPRLERWISLRVAHKAMALRRAIEEQVSPESREVPLLALAAILRGISNMKLSPHAFGSREVKHDAPVLTLFESRLQKMLSDIEWVQNETDLGTASVIEGDARAQGDAEHPLLPASLAICSPPYLNNLDYTMQTRLELFFLGFVSSMEELRGLRKRMMICDAKATYREIEDWRFVEEAKSVRQVAAAIDERLGNRGWGWDYGRMTRQYFGGLMRAMQAVRPMLALGASLVMIVGESAHSGVLVPVPDMVAELGLMSGYRTARTKVLRTRRSSSHSFTLKESAVVLTT